MEYIRGSLIEEQLRKVKRGVWMGYLYVCEQGASIGIADNRFQVKYRDGMIKRNEKYVSRIGYSKKHRAGYGI